MELASADAADRERRAGIDPSVTAGTSSQADVYDASGNLLLEKDSTAGTTLFLGATELHLASGASTASAVRTYTANGIPVAERSTVAGVSGSTETWLAADAQGTVDLQMNVTTGTFGVRLQDPFGNARGTSTTTWGDGHGFLNATTDALSGLVQLGARMYDATTGRFLSVDPVLKPTDPQQNNGYSYAHNSPIDLEDPNGLDPAEYWNPATAPNHPYVPPGVAPQAAGNGGTRSVSISRNVTITSGDPNRTALGNFYQGYAQSARVGQSVLNNPYNQLIEWKDLCAASFISSSCNQQFKNLLSSAINGSSLSVAAELAAGGQIRLNGSTANLVGSKDWQEILALVRHSGAPSGTRVAVVGASPDLPSHDENGSLIVYSYYSLSTNSGPSVTSRVARGSDGSVYFSTDNFLRPERIYPVFGGGGTIFFSPGGIASPFGFDAEAGGSAGDWGRE